MSDGLNFAPELCLDAAYVGGATLVLLGKRAPEMRAFAVTSFLNGPALRAMLHGWSGVVLAVAASVPQFDWGRRRLARLIIWSSGVDPQPRQQ